jgi:hypothetical protein
MESFFARRLLRLAWLCAVYIAALLGIVIALRTQDQQPGGFQINFEYRVF